MRYVYAIRVNKDYVKFGLANNPIARMAELQTGNAEVLRMSACIAYPSHQANIIEKVIHACLVLQEDDVQGEWFKFSSVARSFISAIQAEMIGENQAGLWGLFFMHGVSGVGENDWAEMNAWADGVKLEGRAYLRKLRAVD
jgi:hypothetical protein